MLNVPRNTTSYGIASTNTLRANSEAILDTWGTNLQNQPKILRKIYKPDEGKIFIQRDQSGAEARIVAYLCPFGSRYRDLFLYDVKPHVFVALHNFLDIWRIKVKNINLGLFIAAQIKDLQTLEGWKALDELIKDSDNWASAERYYYIAKMICHASNYGMGVGEFRLNVLEKSEGTIVLTKKEAENYLGNYHSLFPEIHEWHKQIEEQLRATATLYNLFGYPRFFSADVTPFSLKKAYSFIPQSTVGVITHIAITRMQRFIEENHLAWDILANTHDSFLCQCPIKEEDFCNTTMKDCLEIELTSPYQETFKMKSEGASGYNWMPYKKGKNEDGLKATVI